MPAGPARAVAHAFIGTIWVYNRVGKTGSESLLELLKQHCLVETVGYWAPGGIQQNVFGFDNETARSAVLIRSIHAMRLRRAIGTVSQCRVVFGHFPYVPLPAGLNARYINMVREPLARWQSLHAFYKSHHWCLTPSEDSRCSRDNGRRTYPDANQCVLAYASRGAPPADIATAPGFPPSAGTAVRACVSARDAMMSDYFFRAGEEQDVCDTRLLANRYGIITVLERSAEDLPRLLRLLHNGSDAGADRAVLPHRNRTPPPSDVPPQGVGLSAEARAVIARELWCDYKIYGAVLAGGRAGAAQAAVEGVGAE